MAKGRKVSFFSSRRRHTRLQGDWSSDVCSSDLSDLGRALWLRLLLERQFPLAEVLACFHERSGERRVGKECRSRWSAYHLKKKYSSYNASVYHRILS